MTLDGGGPRSGAGDVCTAAGDAGTALVAEAVGLLRRALDGAAGAAADARLAHAVDWGSTAAGRFRQSLEASLVRLHDDVARLAVAAGTTW
jgi:hypothetical protein